MNFLLKLLWNVIFNIWMYFIEYCYLNFLLFEKYEERFF